MKYFLTVAFLLAFLCSVFADPEILINERLAGRLSLKAGDSVKLSTTGDMKNAGTFRIKAVYREQADPYLVPLKRNMVKMHLSDLEGLLDRHDQVDLISIEVAQSTDSGKLAARLNSEAIGFSAVSAHELASRNSTTFQVVSRFHKAIAFITMMAGAIFIFALMVMKVEDQRKHFAVMSVTGISRKTILKTLVLESTCFAFLASCFGAFIGIGAAKLVNLYYQNYYQTSLMFARVTPSILFQAASVSFVLGMIAGAFSWFRLKRLRVLEELGR